MIIIIIILWIITIDFIIIFINIVYKCAIYFFVYICATEYKRIHGRMANEVIELIKMEIQEHYSELQSIQVRNNL